MENNKLLYDLIKNSSLNEVQRNKLFEPINYNNIHSNLKYITLKLILNRRFIKLQTEYTFL